MGHMELCGRYLLVQPVPTPSPSVVCHEGRPACASPHADATLVPFDLAGVSGCTDIISWHCAQGDTWETSVPAALTRLFAHPVLDWGLKSVQQRSMTEREVGEHICAGWL